MSYKILKCVDRKKVPEKYNLVVRSSDCIDSISDQFVDEIGLYVISIKESFNPSPMSKIFVDAKEYESLEALANYLYS